MTPFTLTGCDKTATVAEFTSTGTGSTLTGSEFTPTGCRSTSTGSVAGTFNAVTDTLISVAA